MLLQRKNINFNISRNLLIREVEDKFIKINKSNIFSNLNYSQYIVKYTYIEDKNAFERMIIAFYIEYQDTTEKICKIENIKVAKIKINKLISKIDTWFEKFIKTEARIYEEKGLLYKV